MNIGTVMLSPKGIKPIMLNIIGTVPTMTVPITSLQMNIPLKTSIINIM